MQYHIIPHVFLFGSCSCIFDILLYNYTIVSGIVDGVAIELKENGDLTTSLRTLNQ